MDSQGHFEWLPFKPPKNKNIKLTQTKNQKTFQSKKSTLALERTQQTGTETLDNLCCRVNWGSLGEPCNSLPHLAFHLLGMKTLYTHDV